MPGSPEGASPGKSQASDQRPPVCSQHLGPRCSAPGGRGPSHAPRLQHPCPGSELMAISVPGARHLPRRRLVLMACSPLPRGGPCLGYVCPTLHLPVTRAPGWLKGPKRGVGRPAGGRSLWASAREGGRWARRGETCLSPQGAGRPRTSSGGSDPGP